MEREHFSYSAASLFNRCQYAYHLKYEEGLRKIREADHLRLGSLVDKGLESALHMHDEDYASSDAIENTSMDAIANKSSEYLEQDHVKEWADDKPENGDPTIREQTIALSNKAIRIATRTIRHLELGTDKWITVKVNGTPAIQLELKHPIPGTDKHMLGYLDWVATNREGETYIIDFKVRKQRQSEEQLYDGLQDDWQLPLYDYVLREMGMSIKGVAHLNIYGQVPKQPKANKNGSISQAACDTDWPTYADAVRAAGGDPNAYLKMKEKLDAKSWITWTQRYITDHEMEFAFGQLCSTRNKSDDLFMIHPTRNIFPMTCQMCDYQSYCRIDRQGGHAEGLVGVEYYRKGEDASLVQLHRYPVVEGEKSE